MSPRLAAEAGGLDRRALQEWLDELKSAGVLVIDLAIANTTLDPLTVFASADDLVSEAWDLALREGSPNILIKAIGVGAGARQLVVAPLTHGPEVVAWVGLVVLPPFPDRMAAVVRIASHSLAARMLSTTTPGIRSSASLIELLAWVASQERARSAAQEWINRTSALVRADPQAHGLAGRQQLPVEPAWLQLTLFSVDHGVPRWWVSADTAWADRATPAIQQAADIASRCANESAEVHDGAWRALPSRTAGETMAVLVLQCASVDGPAPPELDLLRASFELAEPLLRQWRRAERPLWRCHLDALRDSWAKLRGPGHLVWKASAAASVLALAALLVLPVPDRVTASTAIEGLVRQVVTAPFDGFVAQAFVRPGQSVQQGQLLLSLDDRDLRLDQARHLSEREQAAGKLRQAMAERDATAVALASAALDQADAQLTLTNAKLARAQLRAPLAGLVISGDWTQRIGAPVEPGKEVFEIAAGQGFRVVLHVPDRDIVRVKRGQEGSLRLSGRPNEVHRFKVVNVTASANVVETVNGFRVEAEWVGSPPALSPGMQGVGKIEVGTSNLFTIWTRTSVDWLRMKLWSWWA